MYTLSIYPKSMKKIIGPIWYSVPPTQPTPSNKTFTSFQKGLFTLVFLKPREPFPTPIKWKIYPLGVYDRRLPPRYKI